MTKKKQQLAAYIFGLVFIITMLVLAITIPNPTEFQYWVFRIVLSLAAAGVAAMIPGFIELTIHTFIRAGGALAVFGIVFFYNPASLIVPDTEPKNSAAYQEVKTFFLQMLESSSTNDLESQMNYYAERVDYFNKGIVGKSTIEKDRSTFNTKWPIRKYWLEKILKLQFWDNNSEFNATLLVGYSINNREPKTVTQQVSARRESNKFKITYIKEL